MASEWVPAMLDGARFAGRAGTFTADDVTCVFYGDVFRGEGRFLGGDDLATSSLDDITDPDEIDLLQRWWAEAARTDTAVVPPEARTLGATAGAKAALAALAGSRFLAGATELVFAHWLSQVRGYFRRPETRRQIRDRFAEAITPDTRVVVAHSLGSVVAYESLCANPDWPAHTLVTLGSPLGLPNIIFDRLDPPPRPRDGALRGTWPGGIQHWTNISDRADFVALVRKLHERFAPELVDIEIDNGAKWHDVTRYLTEKTTGRAIADGLHDTRDRYG